MSVEHVYADYRYASIEAEARVEVSVEIQVNEEIAKSLLAMANQDHDAIIRAITRAAPRMKHHDDGLRFLLEAVLEQLPARLRDVDEQREAFYRVGREHRLRRDAECKTARLKPEAAT